MQPQAVLGYGGLTPDQVQELSRLNQLEKLSVPLSIRECIMNLPQIIFVLRCSVTYYISIINVHRSISYYQGVPRSALSHALLGPGA